MKKISIYILTFISVVVFVNYSQAQYYFGRNKIQYNDFDWHVLKTEHFDIYYYIEMKELAEIGAASAEETYRFLEDKFNHNINRRIPLIFYSNHSHFQQTNTIPYFLPEGVGGFFEFLKGRVVVPANGSIYKFKRVLRHELIHVFTHDKHYRILKDHKKLSYPQLPLWYIEGLAEYWSIGWDSESESVIRDAVLNGYIFPLKNMYQIYGSFLMYKEGQAVLQYIADTYGEHKIIQLIENAWKEESFSSVMKLTIGVNYEEFDKEWLYFLKKKKYPLYAENDSPTMVSQKITFKGINTKPAYFKFEGEPKAVFLSNRTGYTNIYLKDLTKKDIKMKKVSPDVLIKGERTTEFESFHIIKSKHDVNKDGILTFVSKNKESDVIYMYDIKERAIQESFRFDHLVTLSSPAWSNDSEKIVFSGTDAAGRNDLYVYHLQSKRLDKLTNDYYDDLDPVWSLDDDRIIFSSDRTVYGEDGYYNIFSYHLASGKINFITFGKHHDYSPVVSPDGEYIAFSSDRDGAFNIWMTRLDNSIGYLATSRSPDIKQQHDINTEIKKLTNFTTAAYDPEWMDNGDLLFTAFENFSYQINVIHGIFDKYHSIAESISDSLSESRTYWDISSYQGLSTSSPVKYKPKFSLDVAQSQITQDPIFGVSGGAQVAMTDMLGNYQYYFLIYNNAQTRDDFLKSFNIAISRADLSSRVNKAFGVYHFAGRYFNWYDDFFYERMYGGFYSLSYPISVFERIEGSINIRHSDKYWYFTESSRQAVLFSNFLSYVKDNALWGPTGPLDGERINITLGNTIDAQYSNVNFYTIIADYRKYFRLSTQVAHAVRLMTMYNHGKEATRFFMGGSWDLRGYPRWQLWGKKIFLVSNELRFPFIDRFIVKFPIGGMGINFVRGATFVDLGNAWDDNLDDVRGSIGFGFRFRLGGFLVLRFDFGKRFTLSNIGKDLNTTSFDIQDSMFSQFFFGWDF